MISHLRIQNFRCLRDVALDLKPLTALVGGNDAGKSAILEAIWALSEATKAAETSNERGEPLPFEELVVDNDPSQTIAWDVQARSLRGEVACRVELRADVDGAQTPVIVSPEAGAPSLTPAEVGSLLGSAGRYQLDLRALRAPSSLSARPSLSPTGDNLAAVLDSIFCGPDRSAGAAIDSALRAAIPTSSGISLRTIERGGGRVEKAVELGRARTFEEHPRRDAHLRRPSDGGLVLAAALALAHSSSPEILLFESPEVGLHPRQIRFLASLLRSISEGAPLGGAGPAPPRQVILTTHSPILLNYMKPDEILLVRRDHEGDAGTRVDPLTAAPDLAALLRAASVGDVWSLLAEDGLLAC